MGISEVLAEAVRIGDERKRRIDTGVLNHALRKAIAEKPPPAPSKGGRLKLLYATQAEVDPPTFVIFLNDPTRAHFGYRRDIQNVIRRHFAFQGTAVLPIFRGRLPG